MDKLATLQQQLQEAEDKKVALQDQVRTVSKARDTKHVVCTRGSRTHIIFE